MAEFLKATDKKVDTNKANADNLAAESTAGIQAPPYHVNTYEDDKDPSDPMDLLGNYLESHQILVPANASSEEKFDYYHAILQSVGEKIDMKPGVTHILALRGVVQDNAGNIIQTASAARYQMAMHGIEKIEDQHHFSDSNTARNSPEREEDTKNSEGTWNDMLIVLTVDKEKQKSVDEIQGSVDPAKTGDAWGSAHLMDGTYKYGIGRHRSDNPDHVEEIRKLVKEKEYMKAFKQWKSGGKEAYNALVPKGSLRVLRDGVPKIEKAKYKDQPESPGFFTDENIEKFEKNKRRFPHKYFSPKIATNGHIGGEDESFSEGCWNMKRLDFIRVMLKMHEQQKISGLSREQFIVKFTLLDASKVGFVLTKSEEKKTGIEQRKDFSDHLDFLQLIIGS